MRFQSKLQGTNFCQPFRRGVTIFLRGKAKGKTWAARAIRPKFRNAVTTRMRRQGRMRLWSAGAKSACPAGTYTLTLKLTDMY